MPSASHYYDSKHNVHQSSHINKYVNNATTLHQNQNQSQVRQPSTQQQASMRISNNKTADMHKSTAQHQKIPQQQIN